MGASSDGIALCVRRVSPYVSDSSCPRPCPASSRARDDCLGALALRHCGSLACRRVKSSLLPSGGRDPWRLGGCHPLGVGIPRDGLRDLPDLRRSSFPGPCGRTGSAPARLTVLRLDPRGQDSGMRAARYGGFNPAPAGVLASCAHGVAARGGGMGQRGEGAPAGLIVAREAKGH